MIFHEAPHPSQEDYVVDSLEAALWALLKTNTFKECLLRAVNLAYDADTIGAIAGGLAGLYYGYDNIPKDWLDKIKKREFIEEMCLVEI
ncbi:MAG: ADP-ribosylglycohydrolase family protein [Lachnospiraceae bacterium]|nr:ADP-ribosylglycohydrolase family protein [Lachnospiraceae bacterium]